ncbi:reverse transcriptase family protein [Bacillus pumilus]|uniref:reverse transcriptase family protein n=1 Tax=Bacillus pumilus TaxID=1408 RepID=UPI00203C33FB|nr:reverse transcriptase family protein [Bacillus pumilus]MCM3037517.1 reverse transcriptase family protein [Bacillus pumilus]
MHIDNLNKFETKILRGSTTNFLDILEEEEISKAYYTRIISKKNGKKRILNCINNGHILYKLQGNLKRNFFDYIPLSSHAYGYVKGKSYYDYLEQHVGNEIFLKLDIRDFFDSIKENKLREVLGYYVDDIKVKEKLTLIDFIIKVVTVDGKLPQGAVTSPVLSNILFRHLDIRISRYCKKFGITYTRYVDDILFSSSSFYLHKKVFVNGIKKILRSYNLYLNTKKIIKTKNEISLNGFVIGEEIRLSRKKTAHISAIIYCYHRTNIKNTDNFIKEIKEHFNLNASTELDLLVLHNYLAGYRSFLLGLLPFDSAGVLPEHLTKRNRKLLYKINEIEKILDLF